ncbi:Zinc finger, HIT-type domain-containing protein [Aphelenchoides fujianensis]|nr:Zinc finger, HIT-type domain-containing protein [Aphelenchoides fujianensis]
MVEVNPPAADGPPAALLVEPTVEPTVEDEKSERSGEKRATDEEAAADEPQVKRRRGDDVACESCQRAASKYTCPKCRFRSCSVECVKAHKEEQKCTGEAQPKPTGGAWAPVPKLSAFTATHSLDDQEFLHDVRERFHAQQPTAAPHRPPDEPIAPVGAAPQRSDDFRFSKTTGLLIKNARQRRIWLKVKEEEDVAKSHYEGFSDTVFWTVRLRFVQSVGADGRPATLLVAPPPKEAAERKLPGLDVYHSSDESAAAESPVKTLAAEPKPQDVEEGELEDEEERKAALEEDDDDEPQLQIDSGEPEEEDAPEVPPPVAETAAAEPIELASVPLVRTPLELRDVFVYSVDQIPETLTVRTLLRQFVRPRDFGPLVSRSDLNVEALAPFLAAPDAYLLYMPVRVGDRTKFYEVDREASLLTNLRNRVVCGHPELIVAPPADPYDFAAPSVDELEQLKAENQGNEPHQPPFHHNRGNRGHFHGNANGRGFRGRGGFRGGGGGFHPNGHGGANRPNFAPNWQPAAYRPPHRGGPSFHHPPVGGYAQRRGGGGHFSNQNQRF